MRRLLVRSLLIFLYYTANAQNIPASEYATTITKNELKELLTIIASDAMEGRDTGSRGQKMAATFIEEEFKAIGLKPVIPVNNTLSFRQVYVLEDYDEEAVYLKIGEKLFSLSDNILYKGRYSMKNEERSEVILIGPDQVNQLNKLELKDKTAIISLVGISNAEFKTIAQKAYNSGAKMVLLIPFSTKKEFENYKRSHRREYAKRSLAFEQKIDNDIPKGYFLISTEIVTELVQSDIPNDLLTSKTSVDAFNGNDYSISFFVSLPNKRIETENVMGYLEGSQKKDELIVIMAHYDHVGVKGESIYNGADDNGSGTTAVLEIAEAFALAKKAGNKPKRSILFLLVSGEEKGLIGSSYYAANPIFPLSATVACFNLDMIGRYDESHSQKRDYIYLVGADKLSSELHELSEKANATFTKLALDYTYNDEKHPMKIYYRSDHWSFAKYNIPVIFYFSGLHEDYHRPTDTVEKIQFDLLQKRAQLVFYTSWIVANREDRLIVDMIKGVDIYDRK